VDGGSDASDGAIVGIEIVASVASEGGLQGAPGDAIGLEVLYKLSTGGTSSVNSSDVTWTGPTTVTAQNPNDAGPTSILPEAGAAPTAFFVNNPYRDSNDSILFITDPGTESSPTVTVTASVKGHGSTSATVTVLPAPVGDAANGAKLFAMLHTPCAGCHGPTAAGSPAVDAGVYQIPIGPGGEFYPYPAPGLNNTSTDAGGPNLAADPTWSAGLLGMAAQADMDNNGVALRAPMPRFYEALDIDGKPLGAQDFADIYAWLKTQTH
jgi:hypothetical protein